MKPESFPYFYVIPDDVHGGYFILREENVHHLRKSLRLSPGSIIVGVDGKGNEMLAEIAGFRRNREARCDIIKTRRKPNEPLTSITLIQALIKGDRFDYLVEKAVELGVSELIPVHTERCVVAANTGKVSRWRRIAVAAMKQSCRSFLPQVSDVMEFPDAIARISSSSRKLLLHSGGRTLEAVFRKDRRLPPAVVVVVGPEGDFTESEILLARDYSFEDISLGPRRLRSETAGLAAIAMLSAREEA